MKVCLFRGAAEGMNKLTAFDNATLKAGIGNVNILQVSSVVKKDTEIVPRLPEFETGDFLKAVRIRDCSHKNGETIGVAVGIGFGKNGGYVAEIQRKNVSKIEIDNEIRKTVEYMFNQRDEEMLEFHSTSTTHTVINCGSVVAGLAYLEE